MDRKITTNLAPTCEPSDNLSGAVSQGNGYLDALLQRIDALEQRNPQWPGYVYEQVEPYSYNPADPQAQPVLDLSTRIGNVNLRLDALLIALDSGSS